MNRRLTIGVVYVILIITFLTGAVSAANEWSVVKETVNKISIGQVKGEILEEYTQNPLVMPGQTVPKTVNVTNTGNVDSIIRIKLTKAWGESRDTEGNLIVNPSLTTDNIHITCNSDQWYYDSSDGYYYYIGVLKPGETTARSLLDEFTVDANIGNEYKKMQADIKVSMECIQAGWTGVSAWGKTLEQLGIDYEEKPVISGQSGVTFLDTVKGFEIDATEGDLFESFKKMVPGESRSQTISIGNQYDKETEIFLKADFIDQIAVTQEEKELINKLLKEYAVITITGEDGTLIYSGPVWGNVTEDSHGSDSMKYYISLGKFAPAKSQKLTVNISLDPQMDNEYANLLGLVKWTFLSNGKEADYLSPVDTGDMGRLNLSLGVCAVSIILLLIATPKFFRRRKHSIR
ncbi:MAG: hypothetical protein BGN88_14145 [Clostridiales bacterium 43-6]|nr:MAG: hypothetical protein BGN88_14145 [Clostridiales bacterium 43-6]